MDIASWNYDLYEPFCFVMDIGSWNYNLTNRGIMDIGSWNYNLYKLWFNGHWFFDFSFWADVITPLRTLIKSKYFSFRAKKEDLGHVYMKANGTSPFLNESQKRKQCSTHMTENISMRSH